MPTITSDDFRSGSFDASLWTFVDPVGDCSVGFEGAGTQDALVLLTVPAGTPHDAWGENNTARIIQATDDVNFEVEVKFQSVPSLQYQLQGILVQQDLQNYLRFDFYHDGSNAHVFAANCVNGSSSTLYDGYVMYGSILYMRVKREGNAWTQKFSFDGTPWTTGATFTHALSVSSVGVFAGNAGGSSPLFTARVDYFFNTNSPIAQEDSGAPQAPQPSPLPAQAAVTISSPQKSKHRPFAVEDKLVMRNFNNIFDLVNKLYDEIDKLKE